VSDTAIVSSAHRPTPAARPRFLTSAATPVGAGVLLAAAIALALAACGDDGGGGLAADGSELTGAAARGEQLASDKGCTSCHTATGAPKSGPTWKDVWGSEVELTDGRTVTADRAYVERSIRDPGADVVDGYTPVMPEVPLDDDEVDDLVAYIEALGG
jgi:cytochrome c1